MPGAAERSRGNVSAAGWILRDWRAARGLSQLQLATDAGVSARHLSFVETGRAEPSRELLLRLGAALGMPARDRNALLSAAGYQPPFRGVSWEDRDAAELCHAVRLILKQHEPFGAIAFGRDYDVVMVNGGFARFATMLLGEGRVPKPLEIAPKPRLNALAMAFDPDGGVRPFIKNWEQVGRTILWMARAELAVSRNRQARELLDRILGFPGVAALLDRPDEPGPGFVLPLQLEIGGQALSLFTTITTLGTPQDLMASELRIEAYHPADAATEALVRSLG